MTSPDTVPAIDVATLRCWLADGAELALIDVREQARHADDGHPLLSVSLPWHLVDAHAATLVPRRSTRIVLFDEGDDTLAPKAGQSLRRLGYDAVQVLRGGLAAWRATGHEVFTGTNVFSKVFGEQVEHDCAVPRIGPARLRSLAARRDVVLIDSRPGDEYARMHIAGALHCPAAELPYRFDELVPSADVPVVITCAGRTRGILGTQALRNAGVAHDVRVLENGTMGWLLDGQPLRYDQAPPATARRLSLRAARGAEERTLTLQQRYAPDVISRDVLAAYAREADRSLYVFDVRSHEEYAEGHLPGAASAPGTQLVMLLEDHVGTRHARVVLVDGPDAARATLTASWLAQMAWADVHVLPVPTSAFTERTPPRPLPSGGARWVSPYLLPDEAQRRQGFEHYLRWSAGLRAQFARDGTHAFRIRGATSDGVMP